MMRLPLPDLCDAYPADVQVAEPMFNNYGGNDCFSGEIATVTCFEDNSLIATRVEDEDPADLFTEHLTSRDRICKLLDLSGCKYGGGRPDAAPVLRSGVGTRNGALLQLAEGTTATMSWRGRVSPESAEVDVDIPEALPAIEGLLPHLHEDWRDTFPQAVACSELEGEDPTEDEGFEARGKAVGIALGTACGEKRVSAER